VYKLYQHIKLTHDFGLDSERTMVVRELRAMQGRPDIVAIAPRRGIATSRKLRQVGRAMSSHTGAALLAELLHYRRLTEDDLVLQMHVTKRSVRGAITTLLACGLIERSDDTIKCTAFLRTLAVPILAIEAKLRLSKRAIFQARQYRSFASRSVIAIRSDDSIRSLNAAGRISPNLGLIAVRSNGSVDVIRRGRPQAPRNMAAYFYALGNIYNKNVVRHSGFQLLR
jgi:hypothetical protein